MNQDSAKAHVGGSGNQPRYVGKRESDSPPLHLQKKIKLEPSLETTQGLEIHKENQIRGTSSGVDQSSPRNLPSAPSTSHRDAPSTAARLSSVTANFAAQSSRLAIQRQEEEDLGIKRAIDRVDKGVLQEKSLALAAKHQFKCDRCLETHKACEIEKWNGRSSGYYFKCKGCSDSKKGCSFLKITTVSGYDGPLFFKDAFSPKPDAAYPPGTPIEEYAIKDLVRKTDPRSSTSRTTAPSQAPGTDSEVDSRSEVMRAIWKLRNILETRVFTKDRETANKLVLYELTTIMGLGVGHAHEWASMFDDIIDYAEEWKAEREGARTSHGDVVV